MSDWRPIGAAPTDQHILAYWSNGVVAEAAFPYDKWCPVHISHHGCGCCYDDSDVATHWMPLPDPPVTTTKEEDGE